MNLTKTVLLTFYKEAEWCKACVGGWSVAMRYVVAKVF